MRKLLFILPFLAAAAFGLVHVAADVRQAPQKEASQTFTPVKSETPLAKLPIELQEKQRILDSIFTKQSQLGLFNGCVAISYHDTLLYQGSFGTENICTRSQLCNESVFQLASISKMFTGIAVMKLVEEKKLSVKDPLDKYFPGFPYPGTTVEHLLTHRSGLPNYLYFYYKYAKGDSAAFTNARVLQLLNEKHPLPYFRPGKRFQYCNTNYVLLALLVEQLSGRPFTHFMKQEIFEKAGMSHTSLYHPLDTLPHQTFAFTNRNKQYGTDIFDGVYGDKGVFSTTGDMLLFARALFEGKIIASVNLATKPKVPTKYGQYYGYGFRINPNQGDTIVFHNGWWHGFRTAFHYRKRDKTTIVVLSNHLDKTAYQTWKLFDVLDRRQRNDDALMARAYGE
jgi:CubicO group peptidase (beta-lactamase class C family)